MVTVKGRMEKRKMGKEASNSWQGFEQTSIQGMNTWRHTLYIYIREREREEHHSATYFVTRIKHYSQVPASESLIL